MHHEHDGPGILRPRTRREVAAQPVHGHALDNLVRRGSAPGFQSPSRKTSNPFCAVAARRATGLVKEEMLKATAAP